jgi:UPF0755 protein
MEQRHPQMPINGQPSGLSVKRKWYKRKLIIIPAILFALFVLAAATFSIWYHLSIQPLQPGTSTRTQITVEPAMDSDAIGSLLEDRHIVKNAFAFSLYTKIHRVGNQLQAGTYSLSSGESVAQIVEHLTGGNVEDFDVTFLPGATLADNRQALIDAGFSAGEVEQALTAQYEGIVFQDKPVGADLEGYIYGETYRFGVGTTAQAVLQTVFNEYSRIIQENNIIARFEAQGLDLHQGIILASIIQREVPHEEDQRQVAQVFLKRYRESTVLGSDVTYMYAAKRFGGVSDPSLDSPYNTRRYAGLPPGPIAVPGFSALEAVADPAEGDYEFFLSGDDDVTYFARTMAEHEQNIIEHCQVKCSL